MYSRNFKGYRSGGGGGHYGRSWYGYKNRNWSSTGTASTSLDPRKYGEYQTHDMLILKNTVNILAFKGNGSRIICFHHAGLFYFGQDAVKMFENQVQYMMPTVMRLRNGYPVSGFTEKKVYSMGTVPHLYYPDRLVVVGAKKACAVIFNFLACNVYPIILNVNDIGRQADLFGDEEKLNAFGDIFCSTLAQINGDPLNAASILDPGNAGPDNGAKIVKCIADLIGAGFIILHPWTPNYRKRFRSWTDSISDDFQMQPDSGGGGGQHGGQSYLDAVASSQTDIEMMDRVDDDN